MLFSLLIRGVQTTAERDIHTFPDHVFRGCRLYISILGWSASERSGVIRQFLTKNIWKHMVLAAPDGIFTVIQGIYHIYTLVTSDPSIIIWKKEKVYPPRLGENLIWIKCCKKWHFQKGPFWATIPMSVPSTLTLLLAFVLVSYLSYSHHKLSMWLTSQPAIYFWMSFILLIIMV